MLFLIAVAVTQIVLVASILGHKLSPIRRLVASLLLTVSAMSLSALLFEVAPQNANLLIGALLVFAVGVVVLMTESLLSLGARGLTKRPAGATVPMLLGLFIAGVVVDHFWFFRADSNSGVAATELASGTDVKCSAEAILIRLNRGVAEYRCPTSVVVGGMIAHWPLVPWPDYTSGTSSSLFDAVRDVQANSRTLN